MLSSLFNVSYIKEESCKTFNITNFSPFSEELFYLECQGFFVSRLNLTCTAKGQMIPGRWTEFNTADISFGLDAGYRVVKVGGP